MPITITNRFTDEPIATVEDTDSVREAVIRLVRQGADLRSANLIYADLSYADLSYADLSSADLSYADLSSANLSYADLSSANLSYANLSSADLSSADLSSAETRVNWQSHELLAEILFRAADNDIDKRMVAGLILISRDWCWDQFSKIEHAQRDWAIAELAKWVKEGDGAPALIRRASAPLAVSPQDLGAAVSAQLTLNFDAPTLKEAGMSIALASAPLDWAQRVREVVAGMAGEFLMEEVRAVVEAEGLFPQSSNAWGAVTGSLVRDGVIAWTGRYENTKSPKTHCHPAKVYRSVSFT